MMGIPSGLALLTLLNLLLIAQPSLQKDGKEFKILVFGGWRSMEEVHLYNLDTEAPLCEFPNLLRRGRETPSASIIEGNVTICGGGMGYCYLFNSEEHSWQPVGGSISRARSSSIATFDREEWTLLGGKSTVDETSYAVWSSELDGFTDSFNLDFNLGLGACSVRFNQSHGIVSKGSQNVFWYEEGGKAFSAWEEVGHHSLEHGACGLRFTEGAGYEFIVAGGALVDGMETLPDMQIFNFEENVWYEGTDMLTEVNGAASLQFQNTFLTIGGHHEGEFFNHVNIFDGEEGWVTLAMELATPTCYAGVLHIQPGIVDCPVRQLV